MNESAPKDLFLQIMRPFLSLTEIVQLNFFFFAIAVVVVARDQIQFDSLTVGERGPNVIVVKTVDIFVGSTLSFLLLSHACMPVGFVKRI